MRCSVEVVEGSEGGAVEVVRSLGFGLAFEGWFGRHTFALKSPPRPKGVRVHRTGGPGLARAAGVNASERWRTQGVNASERWRTQGVNASERCGDNDQSRCLSLEGRSAVSFVEWQG